ncbi:hypothetical protein JRI60_48065 [Archangium violaceum]|uniref:type IV pilin protein n=1 Tax=Archangium violaceum TaxID=83451 RepID=UPI00194E6CCE|nr:hypothetical protein [Archangium violaceum]QRN96664.1 hypothetical protein JRI60_48065 [Archangium violaceum]
MAIVLVMLGLLATIAVPRFLAARSRALQAEARHTLKSWAQAQHAYYKETRSYEENIRAIGFTVERGNRYAYYFSSGPFFCEHRDTATLPPNTQPVDCIAVDRYAHGMDQPDLPVPMRFRVTHLGPGDASDDPGISGPCPGCNISAFAVSQLDEDLQDVDTWYIATEDVRVSGTCGAERGDLVPANTPLNSYDDLECGF